ARRSWRPRRHASEGAAPDRGAGATTRRAAYPALDGTGAQTGEQVAVAQVAVAQVAVAQVQYTAVAGSAGTRAAASRARTSGGHRDAPLDIARAPATKTKFKPEQRKGRVHRSETGGRAYQGRISRWSRAAAEACNDIEDKLGASMRSLMPRISAKPRAMPAANEVFILPPIPNASEGRLALMTQQTAFSLEPNPNALDAATRDALMRDPRSAASLPTIW
ncbi:hypothetical protein ACU4GD_01495, partial [Cupriavidus basilensis]